MSCCNGNCGCGANCGCGSGCKGCGMYPDMTGETAAAVVHEGRSTEMAMSGSEGGNCDCTKCQCGSSCNCACCDCT